MRIEKFQQKVFQFFHRLNEIDDEGIDMLTRDLQEFGLLKDLKLRFRE